MKKIIILMLLITACGGDSSNTTPEVKVKPKSKSKTVIEGSVVYNIIKNIIPETEAAVPGNCSYDNSMRLYDRLSCFNSSLCKGVDGERCVFLTSGSKLIANTMVKNGKYKFSLDLVLSDSLIYTLVVEDYSNKKFNRKFVFNKKEINQKMDVTPASTLVEDLKKKMIIAKNSTIKKDISGYIDTLVLRFKNKMNDLANLSNVKKTIPFAISKNFKDPAYQITSFFNNLIDLSPMHLANTSPNDLYLLNQDVSNDRMINKKELSLVIIKKNELKNNFDLSNQSGLNEIRRLQTQISGLMAESLGVNKRKTKLQSDLDQTLVQKKTREIMLKAKILKMINQRDLILSQNKAGDITMTVKPIRLDMDLYGTDFFGNDLMFINFDLKIVTEFDVTKLFEEISIIPIKLELDIKNFNLMIESISAEMAAAKVKIKDQELLNMDAEKNYSLDLKLINESLLIVTDRLNENIRIMNTIAKVLP